MPAACWWAQQTTTCAFLLPPSEQEIAPPGASSQPAGLQHPRRPLTGLRRGRRRPGSAPTPVTQRILIPTPLSSPSSPLCRCLRWPRTRVTPSFLAQLALCFPAPNTKLLPCNAFACIPALLCNTTRADTDRHTVHASDSAVLCPLCCARWDPPPGACSARCAGKTQGFTLQHKQARLAARCGAQRAARAEKQRTGCCAEHPSKSTKGCRGPEGGPCEWVCEVRVCVL